MAIKLYNSGFSRQFLTLDPSIPSGYGLRAANATDVPLLFTVTNTTNVFQQFKTTVSDAELCLDVYGDASTTVHLATCGGYLGQQWWWTQASGGAKLSNNYTGSGWYLDVSSGLNQAFMSSGDFVGQYWQVVSADETVTPSTTSAATSPASTIAFATSSGASSIASAGPTQIAPSPSSISQSSGLSTGTKVGVGIGVALGVIAAVLCAIAILFMGRRRKQHREEERSNAHRGWDNQPAELGHEETKRAFHTRISEMPSDGGRVRSPVELEGSMK